MNILEHRALPGPNPYSPYPTILMRLDLGEFAERSSRQIEGFTERLLTAIPSLREHRCSEERPGGLVVRLEEGTYLGHVVEHVAIELQCLAGIRVGFGKTRETSTPGVYQVVYRYREEKSGLEAGRLAVELVEACARGEELDVDRAVDVIEDEYGTHRLGPSTLGIVREAKRRGIPVMRLDDDSYFQLGHGVHAQRMQATLTGRTSCIGAEIADDKDRTKDILRRSGIPVPRGILAKDPQDALEAAQEIGFPVVAKPLVGNHGRGITTNIRTPEQLAAAYEMARAVHRTVLIERQIEGHDFRVLVVNHRFVAAARRDPAQVIGDGQHTVQELIDLANRDPRRGSGHEKTLTRIRVDEDTERLLVEQGLELTSVVADGRKVLLKGTANMSTGGTAVDVTSTVHPEVRRMCERASRIIGLDIMGLDIVAPNLFQPLRETGGAIIEVNAAPGIRMHLEPSEGRPRNVASSIIDMLFPPGSPSRIPIVAITGTNGKTTTVLLMQHILLTAGAHVGTSTTSGIYIDGELAVAGDYSGPDGARTVLQDPAVDHAVLEVARGGILRRGLGYDQADVGVFLNVANDHLGEGGIETVEDLAEVKAVVVENVRRDGAAVLNADDPLVFSYNERLRCRTILFTLDAERDPIHQHLSRAGTVVTVHDGDIVVRDADGDQIVAPVSRCPLAFGGAATFNVQNLLAATAAAHALRVPIDTIRTALETFAPTPETLPGRLNVVPVRGFRVLVDYGHNVPALKALVPILDHLGGSRRVAVASASGNRRDEDIRAFGRQLAEMYDMLILCDPDPRGRPPNEAMMLLKDSACEAGMRPDAVRTMANEPEAVQAALQMAQDGDLVVLQVDDVRGTLDLLRDSQPKIAETWGPEAREHGFAPRPRPRPARAALRAKPPSAA